jgi:hypothetical protein
MVRKLAVVLLAITMVVVSTLFACATIYDAKGLNQLAETPLYEKALQDMPYNPKTKGTEVTLSTNDIKAKLYSGMDGKVYVINGGEFSGNGKTMANVVGQLLSDEEVSHVQVIFPDNATPEELPGKQIRQSDSPQVRVGAIGAPLYIIKNVKARADKIGNKVVAAASGDPDTIVNVAEQVSVSNTCSATLGLSAEVISASVGWNITKSVSRTVSGSWKVPKKHKGKKVKKGFLDARILYEVKSFESWKGYSNSNPPSYSYYGTGVCEHSIGCDFSKRYTYK